MADYQKLDAMRFNAAGDALDALEESDMGRAKDIQRQAQTDAGETCLKGSGT